MSAEILRRAASLMRERAEAVVREVGGVTERWYADVRNDGRAWIAAESDGHFLSAHGLPNHGTHIASWHPAVALAVADWLDRSADWLDRHPQNFTPDAVAVARVYLGEAS